MNPAKTPHPCPCGCGETSAGRKFFSNKCRAKFHNSKRDYTGIKKQGMLPMMEPPVADTRAWPERRAAILAKRDSRTKRYSG